MLKKNVFIIAILCLILIGIGTLVKNHSNKKPQTISTPSESVEKPERKTLFLIAPKSEIYKWSLKKQNKKQKTIPLKNFFEQKKSEQPIVTYKSPNVEENFEKTMGYIKEMTEEETENIFRASMRETSFISPSEKEAHFRESMGENRQGLSETEKQKAFEISMKGSSFMSKSEREKYFRESMELNQCLSEEERKTIFEESMKGNH